MFCVSLSFKTAKVQMREKFSFDQDKTKQLLSSLQSLGIFESVYLCTCNRCELYGVGDGYKSLSILARFSDVSLSEIKNGVLIFNEKSAVRHLFSVCCGLDSMVVGEDEILGQVKRAYAFSHENGFTGYELNTVFKAAVTDAKMIKTKTLLSKTSVSVATLAAAKCHKFKDGKKTALVIGASGDTGQKVLKNLLSYGEFEVYATVRQKHLSEKNVSVVSYAERYDFANKADVIISATSSPHFTFTAHKLKEKLLTKKERLFVDLAVPKDIDGETVFLDGASLITIDDFEKIAQNNNKAKSKEVVTAKEIMSQQADALFKQLSFEKSLPMLKETLQNEKDIMHFLYDFRDCANSKEFETFLSVVERMRKEKEE